MRFEDKICRSCGRRITWRKKWDRSWEQVLYCGEGCRRRGLSAHDQHLEDSIRTRLTGPSAAVSLADIAAAHASHGDQAQAVRRAARRLVAAGEIEMMQGGRVVDPSTAKGPITVRLTRGVR
jgi:hypothetical protein